MGRTTALLLVLCWSLCGASELKPVYAGKSWATKTPAEAGLDEAKLKEIPPFARGSGCVVRHGYMVYTWGDAGNPFDVQATVKLRHAHSGKELQTWNAPFESDWAIAAGRFERWWYPPRKNTWSNTT